MQVSERVRGRDARSSRLSKTELEPHRLAVVSTHPIQYFSPVFRQLASMRDIELKVFYGLEGTAQTHDHGFGQAVEWDIPLLDGYEYEFVENVSTDPGSHHFRGVDLPTLNTRIENWQADSVLIYGWCYKAHLKAMRYFKNKIPVLFRGDSTLIDEQPGMKTFLRRRFLSWVYRHVDLSLYVGQNNKAYFGKHGLNESQLAFAPHAVDNTRFESIEKSETQKIREKLNIGYDELVFLFVGKLEHKKAPDLLLNSFLKLQPPNAHLVFAGSGEMEETLEKHANGNVHFLGFQNQSQMPGVYSMADVVLLPSRGPGETWGLALNEAMACGRAVMASDRVGAAVDLVQPGKNGWVFAANDQAALCECLKEALEVGRDSIEAMGETSRKIIADWTVESQCKAIGNVLGKLSQI